MIISRLYIWEQEGRKCKWLPKVTWLVISSTGRPNPGIPGSKNRELNPTSYFFCLNSHVFSSMAIAIFISSVLFLGKSCSQH